MSKQLIEKLEQVIEEVREEQMAVDFKNEGQWSREAVRLDRLMGALLTAYEYAAKEAKKD